METGPGLMIVKARGGVCAEIEKPGGAKPVTFLSLSRSFKWVEARHTTACYVHSVESLRPAVARDLSLLECAFGFRGKYNGEYAVAEGAFVTPFELKAILGLLSPLS